MAVAISESEKEILHQAVDTGDAAFIARCVYNIEEILQQLQSLLSAHEHGKFLYPVTCR